ncbi:unnamed protein product [Caenorhabditis auriculariae]|uniref:Uncharacterized protein n=1 Tax=Caenorhabditis auriculariae TaxID=2777116 RepID=A0A8S1HSD4_9PELO|nr:unnamed protein product [Caenorhabditis auriculariae]
MATTEAEIHLYGSGKRIFAPGWARTTNLSVNSRTRCLLRHGSTLLVVIKKCEEHEIEIGTPFTTWSLLNCLKQTKNPTRLIESGKSGFDADRRRPVGLRTGERRWEKKRSQTLSEVKRSQRSAESL